MSRPFGGAALPVCARDSEETKNLLDEQNLFDEQETQKPSTRG